MAGSARSRVLRWSSASRWRRASRLALIEAEGRRILVATSAEGGPAFYPLDENGELQGLRECERRSARPVEGLMVGGWFLRMRGGAGERCHSCPI